MEFRHERLAKAHDLRVRAPLGIEVSAAFAGAEVQAGQAVLEELFKGEKLEDARVNGRIEAQAAFVRAERVVQLHSVTAVDMRPAVIIVPYDPETDDAIRLRQPLQNAVLPQPGVLTNVVKDMLDNAANGLVILVLARMPRRQPFHKRIDAFQLVIFIHSVILPRGFSTLSNKLFHLPLAYGAVVSTPVSSNPVFAHQPLRRQTWQTTQTIGPSWPFHCTTS